MDSLNPILDAMMDEYRQAMHLEASDLPMNSCFERWLSDAAMLGLTPEGIRICIQERQKFNRNNQCKKGCELKHLVRSEDDVAVVLNEIAVFKASQRIKVLEPAKASVLRATGRPDTVPQSDAKVVGDTELMRALRKAVQ